MNYYNPYFSSYPYMSMATSAPRLGLMGRLNFGSILSGTQKTLNIVNQTIPIIKQATPIMKNAKTMFKVMNEFKKVDTPSNSAQNSTTNIDQTNKETTMAQIHYNNESLPTFFQ